MKDENEFDAIAKRLEREGVGRTPLAPMWPGAGDPREARAAIAKARRDGERYFRKDPSV